VLLTSYTPRIAITLLLMFFFVITNNKIKCCSRNEIFYPFHHHLQFVTIPSLIQASRLGEGEAMRSFLLQNSRLSAIVFDNTLCEIFKVQFSKKLYNWWDPLARSKSTVVTISILSSHLIFHIVRILFYFQI
jgi:hypothetical protein